MGLLVAGKWQDVWYPTKENQGEFVRSESQFKHWITADGRAGSTGNAGFKAEANRYHLYVSYACPWAHRTLIFRKLKGLEKLISISVVHWHMAEDGWTFREGDGVIADPLFNAAYLREVYLQADSNYSGRVVVPVLWDKRSKTIVSNESADIIRMFNSAFNEVGASEGDYYPQAQRTEIDDFNKRIYDTVNNGVYKAGFATTQQAYESAVMPLFATLDCLEKKLATQRYLTGTHITEADWRLFTTLVRFDPVYVGHFKCNLKRLVDYPNLWAYTRDLYQQAGIAETINMQHIKQHYYGSHTVINPTNIVPLGPEIDFGRAHNRNKINPMSEVNGQLN